MTPDPQPASAPETATLALGSDNFTNCKPFIVTVADIKKPWSGGQDGKYFRCYLCGHKFVPGDVARWEYTNNTPGAGGNPMVCQRCDGSRDEVIAKWRALQAEFRGPRFWALRRS